MKINVHLKILFEEYIKSKKTVKYNSIEMINDDKTVEILEYIADIIEEDLFFVFKKDSTKFNSKLMIIQKRNIINYFNSDWVIYSPETLDFLMVGHYEGFNGKKIITGTDIDCSGIFVKYLMDVSEKFKLKIEDKR